MLALAIEEEVKAYLSEHSDDKTSAGFPRFVRNGYLPERSIQTGIGHIHVKAPPRVRDGLPGNDNSKSISSLIPP